MWQGIYEVVVAWGGLWTCWLRSDFTKSLGFLHGKIYASGVPGRVLGGYKKEFKEPLSGCPERARTQEVRKVKISSSASESVSSMALGGGEEGPGSSLTLFLGAGVTAA